MLNLSTKDKINISKNDPKKLWEIINNKLGKTKKGNTTIKHIFINKQTILDKEKTANHMNEY